LFAERGGVKRKHEDIMHIAGSETKTAHIEQPGNEGYVAVQNLVNLSDVLVYLILCTMHAVSGKPCIPIHGE
jgi:hypothetical protein